MVSLPRTPALWPAALACVLLAACGADAAPTTPPADTRPEPARGADEALSSVPQLAQAEHASALTAARALEFGDLELAARALGDLPAEAEFDRRLLTARLLSLRGDAVGAVRAIESLRAEFPGQSRVFATAAELHAAAGRIESSEDEVRRGLGLCGPTPALTRARGILAISRRGAASTGLGHLLQAREEDPDLWFCDLGLSQAQVLLGNAAMADQRPLEALGHARAARVAVPDSIDARELEADASAALGDYAGAIAGYESLLAEGRDVASTLALLYQRGAMAALLVPDRDLALERFLRARVLGLPVEELGFGAAVLATEAERLLEAGIAAYSGRDLEQARADFTRALACTPDSLEIENHLAVSLSSLGEFEAAAAHFARVIEAAQESGIELPEPVHVNLARALSAAGREAEASAVLRAYLAAHPDGPWAEITSAELAEIGG